MLQKNFRMLLKYFGDIENVLIWMDDILVAGDDKKTHDDTVSKVLQRARQVGVVFNKDKLQFRQKEVKYIGQIFDQDGMRIDPDRVKSLQNLDPPTNKQELQRIIGSFNYVRKYIPKMAEHMSPLCKLLKKDCTWIWTPKQQHAFEEMKKVISQALSLTPFDSTKKIILQCDRTASQKRHRQLLISRSWRAIKISCMCVKTNELFRTEL